MTKHLKPIVLAAVIAAMAAITGFFIARTIDSGNSEVVAQQPGPSGPEDLPPEVQAQIAAVEDDAAKPRFIGNINGIEMTDPDQSLPPPAICTTGQVEADARPEEVAQSDLNFTPGSIPDGLELVYDAGSICQNQVIHVVKNYARDGGSEVIVVAHSLREAAVRSDAPEDRLEATTVGGHPAVLQHAVYEGGKVAVYIDDGETFWSIWGEFLSEDELVAFAEGLK
jgi:hypothetical protein